MVMVGGLAFVVLGGLVHCGGGEHHVVGVKKHFNNWSGVLAISIDELLWVS